jgi:TolB protein
MHLSTGMRAGPSLIIERRTLIAGSLAVALAAPLRALAASDDQPHDTAPGDAPPWLIALPPFVVPDLTDQSVAHEIMQIVSSDLRSTGLFAPIDASGYIETILTIDVSPRFADWRAISAQVLLTGRISRRLDDMLAVETMLWDVGNEQQITSQRYVATAADCQRVSHLISTDVVERVPST